MKLVHITKESLAHLSPDEVAAIEAGANMKICDYGTDKLLSRIIDVVASCYYLRGQTKNLDPADLRTVSQEFTNELQKCFTTFTVEQILQAVRMGALGKLEDEAVHISVYNLCRWVNLWNDKIKREAIHKNNKILDAQIKEKTEAEKQESINRMRKDIEEAFKEYKELGIYKGKEESYYALMYEHLEAIHGPLPTPLKNQIWELACTQIKKEEEHRAHQDRFERKFNPSDYLKKLEGANIIRARFLALGHMFNKIGDRELWNTL